MNLKESGRLDGFLNKETDLKGLVFGSKFSDHMLSIKWKLKGGWDDPEIRPYDKISIFPSASVFHYGLEARIEE